MNIKKTNKTLALSHPKTGGEKSITYRSEDRKQEKVFPTNLEMKASGNNRKKTMMLGHWNFLRNDVFIFKMPVNF